MSALLSPLRIFAPSAVSAAVAACQAAPGSRYLAGGTDLIVGLRRGLETPPQLIDLSGVAELQELVCSSGAGARVGAAVSLAQIAADAQIRARYPALSEAAAAVAAPAHRNLATVGGNLCLNTRCIYYNQSDWWRRANGFCLKYRGSVCHVAPQGQRCHAAFSGDLAAALLALDARIEVAQCNARRHMPLAELYREDGRAHLTLAPEDIVLAVELPGDPPPSAYAKVRVRGSIDFPLAGVGMALRLVQARVAALRVALTGTNSAPFVLAGTESLIGRPVDADMLKRLDTLVQQQVQPMRTTLTQSNYRRVAAGALARRLALQLASGVPS